MKRNYGIDLLRIISMFMIVVLHTLGQGGILNNSQLFSTKYCSAYLLECFCICAVNCFALTSGYVLYGQNIKISKLMQLWLQIIFYTIPILILFYIFKPDTVTALGIFKAFLPITSSAYWYLSAYFGMYIFIPVLNTALENISKKHMSLILLSIFIFIICLPTPLHTDPYYLQSGYTMVWLMILYLFGGYIKKYGFGNNINNSRIFSLYILASIITWTLSLFVVYTYYSKTSIHKGWGVFMRYTSPTVFISAISLFLIFIKIKISQKFIHYIMLLSPACLSVYIIHTNPLVFNNILLNLTKPLLQLRTFNMLTLVLLISIIIYLICSLIDLGRLSIFKFFKIKELCNTFEQFILNKISPNNSSHN